jgi:hypothetical protein
MGIGVASTRRANMAACGIIRDGGVVLMCGPCMQEFGLQLDDLVPGVVMGRPGFTQAFILAQNARTLTW